MEDHVWVLFAILGALLLMQLASIARSLASISGSLEGATAMLKRLLAHQGIEWQTDMDPSARVRELALDACTYVDAIKAYREQTGLGLPEAKAVVDRLARTRQGAA